jgi:hypothetical protein
MALSRCPGVSYGISGRSLSDRFGQVPLHHCGSQIGFSLPGLTFRLNWRRLAFRCNLALTIVLLELLVTRNYAFAVLLSAALSCAVN